ncbi:hypothetical protein SERLA73DRAFT_118644 [Serpula lacrymans var. lacrymans S7.3]|uniref:Uncharacterized protein n=1 Tax=Serpula lacrymans var. lacrymans (strain S7.3) TaxID=936435 RepID=F8PGC6_SERL3|nr:hypothetical protein SERLA73DRAFT_118644 [Serpula lacrymans var. lacrymans S7.3]
MKVPILVLNSCQELFLTADKKQEKAILWLANMTSTGDKQYYTLVLLQHLFEILPLSMTVGVFYNIRCQLHCSCLKWGFLKPYLSCIMFTISVFYAYGHLWSCQIIYHPCKCSGFGLTDGKGCAGISL